MKGQSILVFAIVFLVVFFYFFYFSSNSHLKIKKLTKTIEELEKNIVELETEISRLQKMLKNPSLNDKKNYLRKKRIINSNEMLVDIHIPELNKEKKTRLEIIYLFGGLSIIGLLLLFLSYQFKSKKTRSNALIVTDEANEKEKIHK